MIAFFNFNFLFCFSKKKKFFLFLIFFSFFSFHKYFLLLFFLLFFFLLHTSTLTFFFLFSPALPPHSRTFHTKLSFFLFLFLFSFFLSQLSLATSSASFFPSIPSKHTNLKITHTTTPFDSHQTKIERWVCWSVVSAFCLRRLLICSAFTTACLPPHCCLISSPLPTTCGRNGLDRFFFFFFVLISLLGSFVKLCYK